MWSMPLATRKFVAFIVAACAVTGFVLGYRSVPPKAHLPGEGPPAANAPAAVDALEAQPLSTEPPPPPPEQKKAEEDKKVEEPDPLEAVADASKLNPPPAAEPAPAKPAKPAAGQEDKVGDLLDVITPPPQDDPPH